MDSADGDNVELLRKNLDEAATDANEEYRKSRELFAAGGPGAEGLAEQTLALEQKVRAYLKARGDLSSAMARAGIAATR